MHLCWIIQPGTNSQIDYVSGLCGIDVGKARPSWFTVYCQRYFKKPCGWEVIFFIFHSTADCSIKVKWLLYYNISIWNTNNEIPCGCNQKHAGGDDKLWIKLAWPNLFLLDRIIIACCCVFYCIFIVFS